MRNLFTNVSGDILELILNFFLVSLLGCFIYFVLQIDSQKSSIDLDRAFVHSHPTEDTVNFEALKKIIGFERRKDTSEDRPIYNYSYPRRDCPVFHLPVKFSYFDSNPQFEKAEFNSTADFAHAQFHSMAYFDHAKFYSSAFFYKAKFYKHTCFLKAQFQTYVGFMSSQFDSYANFSRTQFHTDASFEHADFHAITDFSGAHFYGETNFDNSRFDSTVDFGGTRFGTYADFRRTTFKDKINFDHSFLPDLLDFRSITIAESLKNIDLTNSQLDEKKTIQDKKYRSKIALYGSDISKISINMELFELWFPNETYEQKISVYEKVLKKLKDDGFMESYKELDVEYQKLKYQHSFFYIYFDFQEIWWNYGYDKPRVFLWTIGLFVLFLILFVKRFQLLYSIYNIDFLHLKQEKIVMNILLSSKEKTYFQ